MTFIPLLQILRTRNQLLKTVHIHILLQQRNNIGVESLPVGVTQVVLLGRLLEVALDDGEVLGVMDGLHDEPGQSLLVLGVDGGSLEELRVELVDGLLVLFGAEV